MKWYLWECEAARAEPLDTGGTLLARVLRKLRRAKQEYCLGFYLGPPQNPTEKPETASSRFTCREGAIPEYLKLSWKSTTCVSQF